MRTARSLPYWGSLSRGSLSGGVPLSTGISVRETPFLCGQTDACENITLPQTSFADGKYIIAKNCT